MRVFTCLQTCGMRIGMLAGVHVDMCVDMCVVVGVDMRAGMHAVVCVGGEWLWQLLTFTIDVGRKALQHLASRVSQELSAMFLPSAHCGDRGLDEAVTVTAMQLCRR